MDKNETPMYTIYKRCTPGLGMHTDCKQVRGWKKISLHWKSKESRSSNLHISDTIDFKQDCYKRQKEKTVYNDQYQSRRSIKIINIYASI